MTVSTRESSAGWNIAKCRRSGHLPKYHRGNPFDRRFLSELQSPPLLRKQDQERVFRLWSDPVRRSGKSEGNIVTENVLHNTDYGIKFETVVTKTILANNYIDAKRKCIELEATAEGSDIRIFPDNVFSGNGDPVGNYTYLRQTMTPEALAKGVSVCWANSVPTLGDWVRGSIVYKTNVSASECMGWICVASGNPGTWEPFGVIGESRLVLKSPSGSRYAITVTDAGAVVTSAIV
jgi:hypothetical protein